MPQQPELWPSTGEYPIYDRLLYYAMTRDALRNEAFESALRRVAPGRHVVDLGAGADLNWATAALAAGATHATAIESIESTAQRARRRAAELTEYAERLEVVHGHSSTVDLPGGADVVVSETLGSIAGAEGAAACLQDARDRFLRPGGTVVPHRATTMACLADLTRLLGGHEIGFSAVAAAYVEKIFAWHGSPFDLRVCVANADPDGQLSSPVEVERLHFNDVAVVQRPRNRTGIVLQDGHVDGVALWLRFQADDRGPVIDTAETPSDSWGVAFVPVFDTPVLVRRGDRVSINLSSWLSEDLVHPDYEVSVEVTRATTGTLAASRTSLFRHQELGQGRLYRHLFGGEPGHRVS